MHSNILQTTIQDVKRQEDTYLDERRLYAKT